MVARRRPCGDGGSRPNLVRAAGGRIAPMTFPGVIVPLVTPFDEDGALALDGFGPLVEFVLAGGVSGLVAAGTTGEGYAWTSVSDAPSSRR